jgi:spore maturation protein CgeB
LTLNITRAAMAAMGWCPSGRLFEAAACGCPLVSDDWEGLTSFFSPGEEIIVARECDDVLAAIDLTDAELGLLGIRARERVLAEHTAAQRCLELEAILDELASERTAARHRQKLGA